MRPTPCAIYEDFISLNVTETWQKNGARPSLRYHKQRPFCWWNDWESKNNVMVKSCYKLKTGDRWLSEVKPRTNESKLYKMISMRTSLVAWRSERASLVIKFHDDLEENFCQKCTWNSRSTSNLSILTKSASLLGSHTGKKNGKNLP